MTLSDRRRHEIADFLRTRRARLRPEQVGLPAGARRRTRGLRREEVAALAGVSTEWYTRLEQARDVRASEAVLRRLADALRLAPGEAHHLLTLGGYGGGDAAAGGAPAEAPAAAPAHLQRLLDRLTLCPAWVTDARSDVVAWNRAATVIYGDLAAMPAAERNVYVQMLLRPRLRATMVDWAEHARDCVARLRAAHARRVDDPWFGALVDALRAESPEFAAWWTAHDVQAPDVGTKAYDVPGVGRLTFDYTVLDVAGEAELRMVTYVPTPGTATDERMAALLRPAAARPAPRARAPRAAAHA